MTQRISRPLSFARLAFACLASVAPFAATILSARSAQAQDLQPPPAMAPNYAASSSAPEPNADDEKKDSGLGLEWVWLNADIGTAYVNMESFSESQLALVRSSSSGPAFGVGAGVRLLFFTAGLRLSDLQLSAFNLWEVNAEAAFHVRVWRIDPYFGARGGYAFVGSLNSDSVNVATGQSSSAVAVHGFDVGPMVGLDVYLAKYVSLGIDGAAQFLFIQRPPVPLPGPPDYSSLPAPAQGPAMTAYNQQLASAMSNPLYKESGSSVGLGLTFMAHVGIHF